jgi:hypothetical protein
MYSDLADTVRSFYERNLQNIHYFYDAPNHAIMPMEARKKVTPKFSTFQEYINEVLSTGTEPLGIINHWNAWKNFPNVKFLKLNDITTDAELPDFLGIPQYKLLQFKYREREPRQPIETDEYISIMRNIDASQRVL